MEGARGLRGWGVGLGLLGTLGAAPLMAQEPPEVEVELTGRVQIQFSTSSVEDEALGEEVASSAFETRRLRLGAEIAIGEWVLAKVEPEFSGGSLKLADAWIALELDPAATLTVGHLKRPFSLLELTSSTRMLPIERGVRIRGLGDLLALETASELPGEHYAILDELGYVGRDIGASVGGAAGPLGYEIGLFNGRGSLSDANDAKTLAGRLTLAPSAGTPLVLGAGFASVESGPGEAERGNAFELDVEYGRFNTRGLHVMAELAVGDHPGAEREFLGAQGVAGWYLPLDSPRLEALELVGRASWGDPVRDLDGDEGLLLTPGANLYVHGRNRLMLNWDIYLPSGEDIGAVHALRAQANVYF